ncbi:MAG TPA: AraC family transcriptional regulator [Cyanobacteria bacterium UBA8553]|nr:AraC family transcriptional regulator [Cyanobacteria bacterium UBA8553]HAJ61113.1 AraC family transcriptional regulator [Cyanobacteria bacterium UBA8543]
MPEEKTSPADLTPKNSFPTSFLLHEPLLSSQNAGWNGIVLEHHYQPAQETPEQCLTRHNISIYLGQNAKYERRVKGRLVSDRLRYGDIIINGYQRTHWQKAGEYLLLHLEPAIVARAATDLTDTENIEIVEQYKTRDPLIEQIGLALKSELESEGIGSRVYAESLFNALSVHLVRHYCASGQNVLTDPGSLPQDKLRYAVEYIHENLEKDLTLSEIAVAVGMSPYHFTRSFKQAIGLPPHQYLIKCRIEKAKILLAKTDLAIAEIAYRVGFASQSHFTTLFGKHTKTTPKAYRDSL